MMSNKKINQTIKERCIELDEEGSYQDARDEEFMEQWKDFMTDRGYPQNNITEEDMQEFLDSFTFPDENEWICDKAESEAGDYADQAYEQMKDERMGL